jgi:hypothetical protein
MLCHQLRQYLVLALHLLLQVRDAFLFGLVVGAGFGLESRGPVLEELLLSTVEHRRLQPKLVTELGNRLLFHVEAAFAGATFSSPVYCFRVFFTCSLRNLNGRARSPLPAEAAQTTVL